MSTYIKVIAWLVVPYIIAALAVAARGDPVTAYWDQPTTLADGTPMPDNLTNSIAYTLYAAPFVNKAAGAPEPVAAVTNSLTVTCNMPVGKWVFYVTARWDDGPESDMSEPATKAVYGKISRVKGVTVVTVVK